MPSGTRYRLKLGEVSLDLSQAQFDMLSRKVIRLKDPIDWKIQQRVNGLVSKGLFVRRDGAFARTKFGESVFKQINLRNKERARAVTTAP